MITEYRLDENVKDGWGMPCKVDIIRSQDVTDPVKWVSAKGAAEHLGLAVETVYDLVKKREIPGHKLGGMWRFSIQELDSHLLRS